MDFINEEYLLQMGVFYLFTIAIETPVLMIGLSKRHPMRHRIFAGIWLSACTYPFVWIVFRILIDPRTHEGLYLAVAETFAPVAECLLFWLAFDKTRSKPNGVVIDDDEPAAAAPTKAITWGELIRDMTTIVMANLASFAVGVLVGQEFWELVSSFL